MTGFASNFASNFASISFLAWLPAWSLPLAGFLVALLAALRGAAWFTRRVEALGDQLRFSPGMLSLVSALGANVPNYTASLAAFAGHQPVVGEGLIVGSNIFNLAVILALAVFAVPIGHGIVLELSEERDVLTVAWVTLAAAVVTLATVGLLAAAHPVVPSVAVLVANLLMLGLLALLFRHALRHDPPLPEVLRAEWASPKERQGSLVGPIAAVLAPLALALASVIVMVRAGEAFAASVALPRVLLGLVVLAVATSLPNTVVAYQLAREARVTTCVEEVLSSNCVNLALGSALPLLLWPATLADPLLLRVDVPLMVLLTLLVLGLVRTQRINRLLGAVLVMGYLGWVLFHVLA